MTALNRKLFRDLLHLRGQVIAVASVVACGIATYVTMRSAYNAIELSRTDYYGSYRFADIFAQLKRAPESLTPRIAAIPGVATVQTRIVVEVTLDVPGLDEPATGRLISIPERRVPMLNDLHIRRGRYIEPGQRDEVLVSEPFAEAHGLNFGDSIGAVINGRWERLRIVGIALSPEYVYEIRGGDVFPDRKRFGVIWMSREVLGPSFNMQGAFNDVCLSLLPGATEQGVISELDRLFEPYGGLGAYGRKDQVSNHFLAEELTHTRISSTLIPSIFLGIAAFLVHIVLSRLVSTQCNQIGILKSFGYGNTAIGLHYLKLALVAVLCGTALGAALGVWLGSKLADVYKLFFHFPVFRFEIGPKLIGFAFAISGVSACLGAIAAVRSVVSLPPAEAMRPESPARFRPGLLERAGLRKLFSLTGRMILRNIERRPLKALLSVLGVALAVAMLVVGRYFHDAIDYMIEVQFHSVQREDMTVVFNNPLTSRTRYAVAQLPGVLRSESFRVVPARLRFEHRSRRVAILGLPAGGELRRLIDRSLHAFELPPEGILLTTKLAEILGISTGDKVTVEVLEGARPVRQVAVTGLVDELIGLSAYMDERSLNRLMREGETVSGAYLSIDPLSASRLYSLLKRTPTVSGVGVREATLASFKETVAQSLAISTTALTFFACVIALGMVYNGARIALSERGHELASLRVLGFTKAEIAVMLLGEQGLLTLIAIPFGFALGFAICAFLVHAMASELYRMPLVLYGRTYVFASVVVITAAALSGLLVFRRLQRLDLVAVLKARE